jgi:hypothetical protein
MQVQGICRRDEPSWWLGWGAVASELLAVVVVVTWVWTASGPTVFRVLGSVLSYVGGGFAGMGAVVLAERTSPAGHGRTPGYVAFFFVAVTLLLVVAASVFVALTTSGFGE